MFALLQAVNLIFIFNFVINNKLTLVFFNFVSLVSFQYTFKLKFDITPEMTPNLKVLAYFVIDDEIIPDSITLETARCLKNKVKFA